MANIEHIISHPPAVPGNDEIVLPTDPPLVEKGLIQALDITKRQGSRLGNALSTQSEKWGYVWRIDLISDEFGIVEPNLRCVTRFVCWQTPGSDECDGIAYTVSENIPLL